MIIVVLVIHILLSVGLIGVILLQRSEGGALGIGGGGGGFMSGRAAGNLLTRITAILATCFMLTSIGLALLFGSQTGNKSILDTTAPATQQQPAVPAVPALPAVPSAPQSR